jgi:hypothetical protein
MSDADLWGKYPAYSDVYGGGYAGHQSNWAGAAVMEPVLKALNLSTSVPGSFPGLPVTAPAAGRAKLWNNNNVINIVV